MKSKTLLILLGVLLLGTTQASAESDFYKLFKQYYGQMGSNLASNPPAEIADIADFIYEKDVATFTFESGRIYLLRELDGRPTTAIFIGRGHAKIEVPSHVERQSLLYASAKAEVDESFEVCFVNFSDDFDLRLKEKFQFRSDVLPWSDFNRSQQGEFFFKPVIMHTYDNYFQLLRSLFERRADGYFWIDFNRYVYSFDPNRPEEVVVAYEHEGGDNFVTDGAVMQRKEKGVYDDNRMSDIDYPTTLLSREGELRMVGLDGQNLELAAIDLKILVNADSLRFVSLFLHYNLKLDSAWVDGAPAEYSRRGTFTFMGLILPEYRYRGDTLNVRLFYHGKDYHQALPSVENPSPTPHNLTFDIYSGYNYIMPAMTPIESAVKGRARFTSTPAEPYRMFLFQPYAAGYDTVPFVSEIGITLNFITSDHIDKAHFDNFIPHERFQAAVIGGFDFLSSRLGPPPATFVEYIYPEPTGSMPGLIGVSQTTSYADGTGGLLMVAAEAAARQYFGALMQPKSSREYWLMEAAPEYLSLMALSNPSDQKVFFGELGRRRNHIYDRLDLNADRPLATGMRMEPGLMRTKGAWLFHMLRFMMYDLEGLGSRDPDRTFWRFMNELKTATNSAPYTNENVIRFAEQHYGDSLGWFFNHWLYGRNIPEYNVEYKIVKRADGNYVTANVRTDKVGEDFRMPVIIRVVSDGGQSVYVRQMIKGTQDSFELGPYAFTPKEIIFNEFYSVLSKDKIKKK